MANKKLHKKGMMHNVCTCFPSIDPEKFLYPKIAQFFPNELGYTCKRVFVPYVSGESTLWDIVNHNFYTQREYEEILISDENQLSPLLEVYKYLKKPQKQYQSMVQVLTKIEEDLKKRADYSEQYAALTSEYLEMLHKRENNFNNNISINYEIDLERFVALVLFLTNSSKIQRNKVDKINLRTLSKIIREQNIVVVPYGRMQQEIKKADDNVFVYLSCTSRTNYIDISHMCKTIDEHGGYVLATFCSKGNFDEKALHNFNIATIGLNNESVRGRFKQQAIVKYNYYIELEDGMSIYNMQLQ